MLEGERERRGREGGGGERGYVFHPSSGELPLSPPDATLTHVKQTAREGGKENG